MKNWLLGVAVYLGRLRRNREKGQRINLRMTRHISPEEETIVARRRADYAKELLGSEIFQEAIQLMNEQVVDEIVQTDALDRNRLAMLRLRLETISEFPQVLMQFVDNYETIRAIQEQHANQRDKYLEYPEDGAQ